MQVDWTQIWINWFGSVDGPLGVDWGFWIGMAVVALFVLIENVFFWTRKPYGQWEKKKKNQGSDTQSTEDNKQQ